MTSFAQVPPASDRWSRSMTWPRCSRPIPRRCSTFDGSWVARRATPIRRWAYNRCGICRPGHGARGAAGAWRAPSAPDAEMFTAGMRAAGVRNDRPVVVYDAATSMAAARAWWLLRYFGHARVAVLDGGLAAWVAAGHHTQTQEPEVRPGRLHRASGRDAVARRRRRRRARGPWRAARRPRSGALCRRDRADRSSRRPHPGRAKLPQHAEPRRPRPIPRSAALRRGFAAESASTRCRGRRLLRLRRGRRARSAGARAGGLSRRRSMSGRGATGSPIRAAQSSRARAEPSRRLRSKWRKFRRRGDVC